MCEYCGLPDQYHSLPFEVEHIIPAPNGHKWAEHCEH
jgi:hypothetical protein